MAGSGMSYSINLTAWEYEKDGASEGPIFGKLMQFTRHSQQNIKKKDSQIDGRSAAAPSTTAWPTTRIQSKTSLAAFSWLILILLGWDFNSIPS